MFATLNVCATFIRDFVLNREIHKINKRITSCIKVLLSIFLYQSPEFTFSSQCSGGNGEEVTSLSGLRLPAVSLFSRPLCSTDREKRETARSLVWALIVELSDGDL